MENGVDGLLIVGEDLAGHGVDGGGDFGVVEGIAVLAPGFARLLGGEEGLAVAGVGADGGAAVLGGGGWIFPGAFQPVNHIGAHGDRLRLEGLEPVGGGHFGGHGAAEVVAQGKEGDFLAHKHPHRGLVGLGGGERGGKRALPHEGKGQGREEKSEGEQDENCGWFFHGHLRISGKNLTGREKKVYYIKLQ